MKLRNFYYINKKLLEDYISAIEGYIYEEETQKVSETSQKAAGAKAGALGITGDGKCEKRSSEEKERKVRISDAAKFERLFAYLSDSEDTPLRYYEMLNTDIFDGLHRDDFIEVLVTPRFSKMKELSDTVKKISSLAEVFETITHQSILDKKSEEAITGISALGNLKSESEISCVFSFEDNLFPLVARLDESYFKCELSQFVGQFYMLCKIQKKIPKGQSVKIDEIFEDMKKLPLNREQRRKMPKNLDNPDIIRDIVKGPALQVVPIAIYQ
ncbi:DUF6414 family protein [Intestinimonas butyriciproducens]|uniref:DUF6414 family protein n=1 Tax=Intestinimonas butyriciproducens TaxID=1297617 RepID=UPI00051C6829|nr:hypothetical protein [Intestinimonas butyriciproducens]